MASFACLKKETRSTVVISTVHSAAAQQVYIFMLIYLFQLKHLHGQSFLSISLLLSTSSQLFLYLIVAQKKVRHPVYIYYVYILLFLQCNVSCFWHSCRFFSNLTAVMAQTSDTLKSNMEIRKMDKSWLTGLYLRFIHSRLCDLSLSLHSTITTIE